MPLNKDFRVKDALFVGSSALFAAGETSYNGAKVAIDTFGKILSGGVDIAQIFNTTVNSGPLFTVVSTSSANWNNTYTVTSTSSANWNSTYSTVQTNSANWQSTYSNYNTNSAKFVATINNGAAQGGIIYSNVANTQLSSFALTNLGTTGTPTFGGATINGNITITGTVDGRDVSNDGAKLDSVFSTVQPNSANWQSTYSTVQTNSATTWNYQGTDLKALSANWQSTYTTVNSFSGGWQNGYTVTSSNSANWNNAYTVTSSSSANWNSAYSTVQANSATTWNYQGADLKALSANWQSTYTTVNSFSGGWQNGYSVTSTNSARWNNNYTVVSSSSANWNNTYTVTSTSSASWNSVYSTVQTNSANWSTAFTRSTVYASNSAAYFTGAGNQGQGNILFSGSSGSLVTLNLTDLGITGSPKFATLSTSGSAILNGDVTLGSDATRTVTINAGPVNLPNATAAADAIVLGNDVNLYRSAADVLRTDDSLSVGGNTTIAGNLSVLGDFTYLNTTVSVTSSLSVINSGTGPALFIEQDGVQPIAYFIDRNGGSIVFSDTGSIGVGISPLTSIPAEKLTVNGSISASGTAKFGNLAIGSTDSVIIESGGTLQKRTVNTSVWSTTNPLVYSVASTGTDNKVAKFTSNGTTISASNILDDGTTITLSGDVVIPPSKSITRGNANNNVQTRVFTGSLISGSNTVVTFTKSNLKTAKYTVTLASGSLRTSFEILANYNDTTGFGTVYAIVDAQETSLLTNVDVSTAGSTFDLTITAGNNCQYLINGEGHYISLA